MVDRTAVKTELNTWLVEACRRERIKPPRLEVRFSSRCIWLEEHVRDDDRERILGYRQLHSYNGTKVWREGTSGSARSGRDERIALSVGFDAHDRHLVLLHELAHIICQRKYSLREGHTKRFWRVAKRLYEKAGLDMDRCADRERRVYPSSARVLGKIEAATQERQRLQPQM